MGKKFKEHYDVIVIGASLACMKCAIDLLNEGYSVLLLEQRKAPGGVVTSFVREGNEYELSLHEIMSIGEKDNPEKHRLFLEKNGIDVDWIRIEEAYRYIEPGVDARVKSTFNYEYGITADSILSSLGYDDEELRDKLISFLDICGKINRGSDYLSGIKKDEGGGNVIDELSLVLKTVGYTAEEVMESFHFPEDVLHVLSAYWFYLGSPLFEQPFTTMAVVIGDYLGNSPYIPRYTSFDFVSRFAKGVEGKGGTIEYGVKVEKILTDGKKVVGVKTSSGDAIYADVVVSGAYPEKAYFEMLDDPSLINKEAKKLISYKELGLSAFNVNLLLEGEHHELGIDDYCVIRSIKKMDQREIWDNLKTTGPYTFYQAVSQNVVNEGASRKGTTLLSLTVLPRAEAWREVDPKDYEDIVDMNVSHLLKQESDRLGIDLESRILDIIVTTPWDIENMVGSPSGSIYGYRHRIDDHIIARFIKEKPMVKGLSFAGAHQSSGDGMGPSFTNGEKAAKETISYLKGRK